MKFKVLIVDDEKNIRDIFTVLLKEKGYSVENASSGTEGLEKARSFSPDIVLLDMNLPDMSGLEVLSGVRQLAALCRIIIITAFGTIRNAVEATKLGAYAYLEKPVDNAELLLLLSRIAELKTLEAKVEDLKMELSSRYSFSNIVGTSSRMNSVFQMMERIARVDGTVLITGESGTGKELAARAIHFNSPRKDGPFVVVNCGAIPKDLIESEFFGHVKGAFTDAKSEKTGKFELAHRGSIFLDEVSEFLPEAQAKLLRALGEREIIKVGGNKTIPVDVRVITATNKDLEAAVRSGEFREDLYWRLAVLSLRLPPLRERKEDIPLLCEHFIRKYAADLNKNFSGITNSAIDRLNAYDWPGNVRELESVVYEAMVLTDSSWIDESGLPRRIKGEQDSVIDIASSKTLTLNQAAHDAAEQIERRLILKALDQARGNRTSAAKILGISRKTLFNKMRSLGIRWSA